MAGGGPGAGRYVLALDEGSSSARSVLVDLEGRIVQEARAAVPWVHRRPGWAELDPVALWRSQLATVEQVLAAAGASAADLVACAVTTHRETVVVWDRRTGEPVHDALVWISSQTDDIVARWQAEGLDAEFRRRTGLRNDSFFSAAKVVWLLENVPGARARAERGELALGTIDCWLLWNLTEGRQHLTDHSCASRTALFGLGALAWDTDLCERLGIPVELLPTALPSDAEFGEATALGAPVPVRAVVADQQASLYGQACFDKGEAKNTFGTAGVLVVNSGAQPALVDGLTSSVGWTLAGETRYELEGVVFHSGQTVSWLRDGLGLLGPGDDVTALAASVPDSGGVYLVPAFGGLCAPHWDRRARASLVGMDLGTTKAHVARAAVDSMVLQTVDIVDALAAGGMPVTDLKVDGGAARNDLVCQLLADLTGLRIRRPEELERTALGAALMAGTAVGVWHGEADVAAGWHLDRDFEPRTDPERRDAVLTGWRDAVRRTLTDPPQPSQPGSTTTLLPAHAGGAHERTSP